MELWFKSNRKVTQDFVNNPEINGAYLHRFSWLKDKEIGELDHTWNYPCWRIR